MKRVKLGDSSIAEIFSGQPAPQNIKFASSEGFPFIRAKSLEFLCSGGSEEQLEHIDVKTAKKYKLRLFPANTVIFAKSGMSAKIPRVYRLKGYCYLVSHLAAIITHKNLSSKYLECYLKYNHPSSLISNDSYPSIRLSDIKEFEICFPELHEQQKISKTLNLISSLIEMRKKQISNLDHLVKSRFKCGGRKLENTKQRNIPSPYGKAHVAIYQYPQLIAG
ncbi:hypothetical protein B5F76_13720 [Desulfovibrio sp. An276]|uniref:restriction endonuclease subunit S n=1 Tax=Desulfovibrio sp. An276 TaxID=1965618 RepID=UPI000B3A43CD|nr:restriction endonuclease subunit S [Desulfovibrio sp. An276]OUO49537.1 hypothetical protein B5F76_13720 [Desulfovibrio sp. An276]